MKWKKIVLSFKYVQEEDIWTKIVVLPINFVFPWWRKSAINLTSLAKMAVSSILFCQSLVILVQALQLVVLATSILHICLRALLLVEYIPWSVAITISVSNTAS
jgi:hypothetical protein